MKAAALLALLFLSPAPAEDGAAPDDVHAKLFAEGHYPSAQVCAQCHPVQFREWSTSPHAYAQLSPVFNAMQAAIDKRTAGTNGDFCIRCHTQVGMNMDEPVLKTNLERPQVSREGITCVVCHREPYAYGKASGRFALSKGPITEPINGPTGNAELKRVLASPGTYFVTADPNQPGRKVHGDVHHFQTLRTPGFCGSCHDVTLGNGFRLEELFTSFKNSPAARMGTTCQDCHMGLEPGKKSGYAFGPAAIVGGVPTRPRRHANHMFVGPDHPIIHPGLFPHNPKASELATMAEWLTFDYKAGWGTDAFEKGVSSGTAFPARWKDEQDRREARAILDEQFALLKEYHAKRMALLREGYRLGELKVTTADAKKGLSFNVQVRNGMVGHNVPAGFDAERVVFLRVTVADPSGKVVFQSGDLDPDGDLRDERSAFVRDGRAELDHYLFALQAFSMVGLRNGGDHDEVIAVNQDVDPLPYVRPSPFSNILTGRPAGARLQRRSIPPRGARRPKYRVAASRLSGKGPYSVNVKVIAGMVPSNLIREIQFMGFDYGMSPKQVAEAVREGHLTLWDKTVQVALDGSSPLFDLSALPSAP